MSLRPVTPATDLAVSLAEAKAQCRVDYDFEDDLITDDIHSATEAVETIMKQRVVMPQTWELTLDKFPDAFEITKIPAISVTSIVYVDTNGVHQTLSDTLYTLDNSDDYGSAYIVPAYNTDWPETREQINAVVVRYVSGYANAASVPHSIKKMIKMMVETMAINRASEKMSVGSGTKTISLEFAIRLLDRYTVWGV